MAKAAAITWKSVKVSLSKLKPWGSNPRKSTAKTVEGLNESLEDFGQAHELLISPDFELYDGHQRLPVLIQRYGPNAKVDCRMSSRRLTDKERRKLVLYLHAKATGNWNWEVLKGWDPNELGDWGFDKNTLKSWKEDASSLSLFLTSSDAKGDGTESRDVEPELDRAKELLKKYDVKLGQLWTLGDHRLICGDCTDPETIKRLMGKDVAMLIEADPPYGMGKQKDGVLNDNLYKEKLDKFQMSWWRNVRPYVADNGSAYVWGNADDLWRLWYLGGLRDSEKLELRNEIVWDKTSVPGMASDLMHQYPMATERCLFIMFGEQFIGNLNSDQYFEGWDVLRVPLAKKAEAAGLTPKKTLEITGVSMYSHWFTKSQWQFINENYYAKLQAAYPDIFTDDYSKLRKKYDDIKGGYRKYVNGKLGGMRSYFDNAHDIMRDVWNYEKVSGEERQGHATPKPVAMIERIIKSSSAPEGIVLVPFAGSGPDIIACENLKRKCRAFELQPEYVAVVLERWSKLTGKIPKLEGGKRGK